MARGQHDTARIRCRDNYTASGSDDETVTAFDNVLATVTSLCDPALPFMTDDFGSLQSFAKIEQFTLFQ